MKCPFLSSATARYCDASPYRKMILQAGADTGSERCSSRHYESCPAADGRELPAERPPRCPFLHEARTEFCTAAAIPKYIPATSDVFSRCNSGAHRYCGLYLTHADPAGARRPRNGDVPAPASLLYAPNHMWLDVSDDGVSHIGLDAFAACVFGSIERISFLPSSAGRRPVAVLGVHGVDVPMAFPSPATVTAVNAYLRIAPARMVDDPYGTGWLFQASDVTPVGLLNGCDAEAWFCSETERLNAFVHQLAARRQPDGTAWMADGGVALEGVACRLEHDDVLCLVSEFFDPQRSWGGRRDVP